MPQPTDHTPFLPAPSPSPDKRIVQAAYTEIPYARAPDPSSEPESGGLLEYWRIICRRKGTLIVLAVIGAVIGFLVTLPQTPVYQVRTSLEIVSLNQNFLNMKESNPFDDSGSSADNVDIQTQIKILQSESLLKRVSSKLREAGLPPTAPSRIETWRKLLNLPDPRPTDSREAALSYARSHVSVRASGETRIIELTVDSPNPQIATAFANTLTSEFTDQNLETRWKTTEHTGQWLSTQSSDDMRVRLEKSEDRLQQYADQAGLLFAPDEKDSAKNSVSEEKLSQIQAALTAAQTDRIVKQSRWEMANSSPPDALPNILDDGTLRDYEAKLTELNRALAEQRAIYKDNYKSVQRILAQIDPIQNALNQARADILKRIHNEYDESVRKENLLTTDYASQRAVVTGEGGKEIQYSILKREVDSNRQLYDSMLQQLKQSSLASALRASNIHVVDPAEPSSRPYKPDTESSSGIGLLSGLVLGVAFVVMRERADRSIQDPGETPLYLNLPELGVVPSDDTGTRVRLRIKTAKPAEIAPGNGNGNGNNNSSVPAPRGRVELITWQRKPSIVAESFRATLVSILFSGENGSRPRVMVVTSASASEGKSTVVSNLAIAIAEVNHKTLVIDADLRKPRMHDIFNLKNNKGLSELLRSKDPVATAIESSIQETDIPDLYVLTSGAATSAATSLLYSNRMPELIQALRQQFETILIDTPPMLQIPDARVLGRIVDRVILVTRAGKTTRAAAMAARQRFSEDGTKMLGTVLNDWNPKRSPNGYYGTYNGYYYGGYKNGYGYGNGYYGRKPED